MIQPIWIPFAKNLIYYVIMYYLQKLMKYFFKTIFATETTQTARAQIRLLFWLTPQSSYDFLVDLSLEIKLNKWIIEVPNLGASAIILSELQV